MTHLRGVKPAAQPDRDPLTKAPTVPRYLSKFARDEWRRIMPRLIEDRVITKADRKRPAKPPLTFISASSSTA